MVGYIFGGICLIGALLLFRYILLQKKRLHQLSENMEDYLTGHGNALQLSLREDELAHVENAAAEMANRVEIAEERFQQEAKRTSNLTADISHQLKTPLASLRLFCEMDASEHVTGQIEQIERMETLISRLLRLEKLCADGYTFCFEDHSLRPIVEETWDQMKHLWPEKRMNITGDALLRCDQKWMSEAFQNLLKNACEHTAADGCISVSIESTDRAVFCTVEDDGGGVAEKDLIHLFDRFYRAEGQDQQGAGLGLAIVREIIYRHHGHISAENTGKGLRITLSLPVFDLIKGSPEFPNLTKS